jgi:hypothetical protein
MDLENKLNFTFQTKDRHGRNRMVFEFANTYAISAYHH